MKLLPVSVTAKLGRAVLQTQRISPTVLFVGGVASAVTSTVLACKATLKLEDALGENHSKQLEAKNLLAKGEEAYGINEYRHDIIVLRTQAVVQIGRVYAPAILVGAAGITMLTGSHNILNKRNAALTAAYATVERSFKEYRQRIVNEYGEEKERELYYQLEPCEVDDEDKPGKKKTVKKVNANSPSMYARFFNKDNNNWSPMVEYNIVFLRMIQNYANDRLAGKGYLLLNDVYDMLGLDRSTEGCVVGWVKDGNGDNYIDFGIFVDETMDRFYDYIVGNEDSLLLDFNVDGVVHDKINQIRG